MSVNESHWTDYLTDAESRALDEIELAILRNKDELKALRQKHRKFFDKGNARKRRQK